uniref:Uncharacterized protein n=1 Tax=Anguilla anguilla TaxID=7936 RepID=A0A0E9XLU2_ANGAN
MAVLQAQFPDHYKLLPLEYFTDRILTLLSYELHAQHVYYKQELFGKQLL